MSIRTVLYVLVVIGIISRGACYDVPCGDSSECYGDGLRCINGICGCPDSLTLCKIQGSNYGQCYNATIQDCCEGDEERLGLLCEPGKVCCGGFPGQACRDPNTEYCCPSNRNACPYGWECGGNYKGFCYNETKGVRDCSCDEYNQFPCPTNNTCDCDARTCVPPITPCASSHQCGVTDSCCPDAVLGDTCYSTQTHECIFSSDHSKVYLCGGKGNKICNGTCYDPNLKSCPRSYPDNDEILCQPDEWLCGHICYNIAANSCFFVGDQQYLCGHLEDLCNGVCFNPQQYRCADGVKLCPLNTEVCNDDCYDIFSYDCVRDGITNRDILCGKGLGVCNGACFDQNNYQCCDGSLMEISQNC